MSENFDPGQGCVCFSVPHRESFEPVSMKCLRGTESIRPNYFKKATSFWCKKTIQLVQQHGFMSKINHVPGFYSSEMLHAPGPDFQRAQEDDDFCVYNSTGGQQVFLTD